MMRVLRPFAFFSCTIAGLLNVATVGAEVTVETVMVPMRDGVRLATDIYRDKTLKNAPVA